MDNYKERYIFTPRQNGKGDKNWVEKFVKANMKVVYPRHSREEIAMSYARYMSKVIFESNQLDKSFMKEGYNDSNTDSSLGEEVEDKPIG